MSGRGALSHFVHGLKLLEAGRVLRLTMHVQVGVIRSQVDQLGCPLDKILPLVYDVRTS